MAACGSGNAETGQRLTDPMAGNQYQVTSVAFSPDGRRIASGGTDGIVERSDAETGRALGKPMTGHGGPVYSVAFSPDGSRIVSGSEDQHREVVALTSHRI